MKAAPLPANESGRLEALRRFEVLDTPAEQGFDDLTRLTAQMCGTPAAVVSLMDADRQWFKARVGVEAHETPRDISICAHVVACGRTLEVPDTTADERFCDSPLVTGGARIRFYAGTPLTTADGHVVGTLCVIDHVPRELSDGQRDMLAVLGREVVSLLELRRALAEEKRLRRDMAEVAGRMETLVDNMAEGVVTMDEGFVIESFNKAAERIFGWRASEVMGRNVTVLMGEHDGQHHAGYVQRYLETGERRIIGVGREVTARRKDGTDFPAELAVAEVRLPEGRRFTGIIRDISQRKEIDRAKNELLSLVSHELRTPLTNIRGALGLLDGGAAGELAPRLLKLVGIARTNTERLIDLINAIIDLESAETGQLELRIESFAAEDLLREAAAVMGVAADAASVRLVLRLPEGTAPVVRGDRNRLRQVLTILLSNAIAHSPGHSQVELGVSVVTAGLRLFVGDRGPGIAPEQRTRIFDKFQQGDSSDCRAKSGLGLGLSLARAIVREHGGTLGLHTQPGEGSTFWVELASPPATETPQRHSERPGGRPGAPRRRLSGAVDPRVLLVDDDSDTTNLLRDMLSRLSIEVVEAQDGERAVELARASSPDLIILDIGMAKMDGFDVVQRLRAGHTRSTPLVTYSGMDLSGSERDRLTLGITRHLVKTRASHEDLLQTVRDLLAEVGKPCGHFGVNGPATDPDPRA